MAISHPIPIALREDPAVEVWLKGRRHSFWSALRKAREEKARALGDRLLEVASLRHKGNLVGVAERRLGFVSKTLRQALDQAMESPRRPRLSSVNARRRRGDE